MESPGLFQWAARDLDGATLPPQPFCAWVHFDREWRAADATALEQLIRGGCRYLMITGTCANEIHEAADDIAISETNDLVLTTSEEFGESAAFSFVSMRSPAGPCSGRVLIAFSTDRASELKCVTAMKRLVEAA